MKSIKKENILQFVKNNRKIVYYAIFAGILIILLIPVITYVYFVRDLSSKERILNAKNAGVVLLDRNEEPFFTLFNATTKNPVPIDDLPDYTPQAFIAIEDKDFYSHPGFSIEGIGRAVRENILSESFAQGGSTISQQLIKNAILSPDKKLLRKYQELTLALELERRYSKNDILELYMNTIYYGEGAFGIQDASQRYFSKDASELSLAESALLAAIIRAPSYYSPISGDEEEALKRKDLVLNLMHEQEFITEQELEKAKDSQIQFNPNADDLNETGVHLALMIQDILIEEFGEQEVAQSGFKVLTTIDLELQKSSQDAVANQIQRLSGLNASNGAAVAIEPGSGEVLALVGSHDYSDEDNGRINMAVRPRQPGSSYKPIIYAKALDEKLITAATIIEDEQISFGNYTPRNFDNSFRGNVTARYALANSLNIPAVKVMNQVGISDGIQISEELGITTLDEDNDYGLPFVLGAAEVPLIEMTNAYATFANEGIWNQYKIFTEVRDKNNRVVLRSENKEKRAIPQSVAYLIWSILSDNQARTDTFGGSLTLSRQAAVKTGTTEDNRDALTIGYTPQIAVGAWVGNNDNTPMSGIAGSGGAGPIWRQIMEAYLQGKPIETLRQPAGVEKEQICKEDGGLVDFATSSAYMEFFLRGTTPKENCKSIPTPTPTGGEEDEENKDDEDNNDQNNDDNNPTPTPTQSQSPTNTPTPSPFINLTTTPSPTPTKSPTPTP